MATHDLSQVWFNQELHPDLEKILRGIAISHLEIVAKGMSFQNLKQDRKRLTMANGIIIDSSICFGKRTARVYVPPLKPIKPIVVEEEEEIFILVITREYDGLPLTPENMDMGSNGYILISALEDTRVGEPYDDEKDKDWMIYIRPDLEQLYGTIVSTETSKTYTLDGADTYSWEYDYPSNEWRIPLTAWVKTNKYDTFIIRARFGTEPENYIGSVDTYYPRDYRWLPTAEPEVVAVGRYTMTLPYIQSIPGNSGNIVTWGTDSYYTGLNPWVNLYVKTTIPYIATGRTRWVVRWPTVLDLLAFNVSTDHVYVRTFDGDDGYYCADRGPKFSEMQWRYITGSYNIMGKTGSFATSDPFGNYTPGSDTNSITCYPTHPTIDPGINYSEATYTMSWSLDNTLTYYHGTIAGYCVTEYTAESVGIKAGSLATGISTVSLWDGD